ncbi:putative phospholipase B 2-like [Tropilaelaps mercedesae]|uniref:Phospholipase B-like n=1 Tax=Tropilaelaps mercedesae TaxID=418985 RepID=A0A1V9X004_9ACAR|nr:putative phospholipase B 2-like [Tropilaelaps mercedesae]
MLQQLTGLDDQFEGQTLYVRIRQAIDVLQLGSDWTVYMQRKNSFTFTNQWMILDYNKYQSSADGGRLLGGTFWAVEQMPAMASYNVHYFNDIFNDSGRRKLCQSSGDRYGYNDCLRAVIFRRNHSKVTNVTEMIALMRYNNYKQDAASSNPGTPPHNPTYAISAPFNLMDPNEQYFPPAAARDIDVKVTDLQRFREQRFVAINVPTCDRCSTGVPAALSSRILAKRTRSAPLTGSGPASKLPTP